MIDPEEGLPHVHGATGTHPHRPRPGWTFTQPDSRHHSTGPTTEEQTNYACVARVRECVCGGYITDLNESTTSVTLLLWRVNYCTKQARCGQLVWTWDKAVRKPVQHAPAMTPVEVITSATTRHIHDSQGFSKLRMARSLLATN
ncbi:hypothetical protein LIA77_02920 [Sarocladium implicatum]|nr:hypothetical protein LIA77_02920 [Sarocladium implicatum]